MVIGNCDQSNLTPLCLIPECKGPIALDAIYDAGVELIEETEAIPLRNDAQQLAVAKRSPQIIERQ